MGVSLVVDVCQRLEANIEAFSCHTDSKNVLRMLASNAEGYSEADAVRRKVGHILKHTSLAVWHHVATEDNPADLVTKGMKPDELLHSKLWRHGAPQLVQDPYPIEPVKPTEDPLPLPPGLIMATTPAHDGKTRRTRRNPTGGAAGPTNVRSSRYGLRNQPMSPGGATHATAKAVTSQLRPSTPETVDLSPSPPLPAEPDRTQLLLTKATWQESLLAAEAYANQHLPQIKALLQGGGKKGGDPRPPHHFRSPRKM